MFSSSRLTSRKKSPTEESDVPKDRIETITNVSNGSEDADGESRDSVVSKTSKKEAKVPWYDSWKATIATWAFLFFLMYCVHAPARMKKAHRKAVDTQLEQMANAISAQKKSLATKIDEVAKRLELDKVDLGIVTTTHHEKEINKLSDDLKATSEQLATLKREKEAVVQQKEAELKQLRDRMATMSVNIDTFCESCPFDHGGLRTGCGARMNYLVNTYGTAVDAAKEAVMKLDPNCSKPKIRV